MADAPVGAARSPSRRPIIVALAAAVAATVAVIVIVALTRPPSADSGRIEKGQPVPEIAGLTLDGEPFRLEDLRGRPVVVNFWGPTCVPCRTEFPLLKAKLEEHADEGLVVVGILMDDPADLARDFIAQEGATWDTVDDPDETIKSDYRVVARPQSYFIDRDGILRSIQIGEVRDEDFERQYDLIRGRFVTGAAAANPGAAVEVDGLIKRYGGRAVVDGITFSVAPGETFALLGPNGAGKTTTVEILEGYRSGDEGTVRVLGADPAGAGRDHRARVGLMLQGGGGIDPRMTAREVLALHGWFHRSSRPPDELLALVGLGEAAGRTRFRRLSGGERQRLGLALALVGRPELVALDEPTAGMDVEGRAATRALLGTLRGEGVTVLLTSHDLADVERVADRIAILDRGRIVAVGSPGELAAGSAGRLRFRLDRRLDDAVLAELAARVGPVVDEGDRRYRLDPSPATPANLAALAAWCAERGLLVEELRSGVATLEERYLELVGPAAPEPER